MADKVLLDDFLCVRHKKTMDFNLFAKNTAVY